MLSVAKKINTRIDPNKVRIGRGFVVKTITVCIRVFGTLEYFQYKCRYCATNIDPLLVIEWIIPQGVCKTSAWIFYTRVKNICFGGGKKTWKCFPSVEVTTTKYVTKYDFFHIHIRLNVFWGLTDVMKSSSIVYFRSRADEKKRFDLFKRCFDVNQITLVVCDTRNNILHVTTYIFYA